MSINTWVTIWPSKRTGSMAFGPLGLPTILAVAHMRTLKLKTGFTLDSPGRRCMGGSFPCFSFSLGRRAGPIYIL